jgi:hypothetical protein
MPARIKRHRAVIAAWILSSAVALLGAAAALADNTPYPH